jgi:hypothetical protein
VAPQIAGGLRVACIKKTTDGSGSGVALSCGAVENMGFAVADIFNRWERLEENVNGCVPLLSQTG